MRSLVTPKILNFASEEAPAEAPDRLVLPQTTTSGAGAELPLLLALSQKKSAQTAAPKPPTTGGATSTGTKPLTENELLQITLGGASTGGLPISMGGYTGGTSAGAPLGDLTPQQLSQLSQVSQLLASQYGINIPAAGLVQLLAGNTEGAIPSLLGWGGANLGGMTGGYAGSALGGLLTGNTDLATVGGLQALGSALGGPGGALLGGVAGAGLVGGQPALENALLNSVVGRALASAGLGPVGALMGLFGINPANAILGTYNPGLDDRFGGVFGESPKDVSFAPSESGGWDYLLGGELKGWLPSDGSGLVPAEQPRAPISDATPISNEAFSDLAGMFAGDSTSAGGFDLGDLFFDDSGVGSNLSAGSSLADSFDLGNAFASSGDLSGAFASGVIPTYDFGSGSWGGDLSFDTGVGGVSPFVFDSGSWGGNLAGSFASSAIPTFDLGSGFVGGGFPSFVSAPSVDFGGFGGFTYFGLKDGGRVKFKGCENGNR